MDEKSDVLLVTFGDVLGTVAWLFLLCPTCRNCPLRSFLRRKLVLDISFWSWILFSKKLYLMTFCTSFALYKVKKTFGGSRWKLMELTRVSRYLAYVTVFLGCLKPHRYLSLHGTLGQVAPRQCTVWPLSLQTTKWKGLTAMHLCRYVWQGLQRPPQRAWV